MRLDNGQLLRDAATTWQRQDWAALDPALRELAHPTRNNPVRRAWIERPRGHSKTTDLATTLLYVLLHVPGASGILAAEDKEQAQLLLRALERIARANNINSLKITKATVTNPDTHTVVEVIPADTASSWGILPDLVICDEVCHWTNESFWHSLTSSAAKKRTCVLVCLTNAGAGREWQWELRETARTSDRWYFHSLDGPQAPWITEQMLAEQRELLPATVYARLWLNEWQDADNAFLTLDEVDACCDPQLRIQHHGHAHRYLAVIDYAEKHDHTAACIAHYDWQRHAVIVDRLDVVEPTPDNPTPVAWCEHWLRQTAQHFPGVEFVVDEWQLLDLVQRYEHQLPIERFAFRSGQGNSALAVHLHHAILNHEILWYPGCGALPRADGTRDDLATEIASLHIKHTPAGYVRFEHDPRRHDDRAFVAAVASLTLAQRDNTPPFSYQQSPSDWRAPFSKARF